MLALHAEPPRIVAQVVDHSGELPLAEKDGIHIAIGPETRAHAPASRTGPPVWPLAACGVWLPAACGEVLPHLARGSRFERADDIAERFALGQLLLHKEHAVEMLGHELILDQFHLRPAHRDLAPAGKHDSADLRGLHGPIAFAPLDQPPQNGPAVFQHDRDLVDAPLGIVEIGQAPPHVRLELAHEPPLPIEHPPRRDKSAFLAHRRQASG